MRPVFLSRQYTRQLCLDASLAAAAVSVRPCSNCGLASLLMAVVTKTRSPHTTGLECARPGIGVFHAMLADFSTSQVTGGFIPSATPDACVPRNDGQFCPIAADASKTLMESESRNFIARSCLLFRGLFSQHRIKLCEDVVG